MITCSNCHSVPKIDVYEKDKTKAIIKCYNCGKEDSVHIEDLINSKSEYTNPFIPNCSRKTKHKTSITAAEKFCEKCGYYFCKSCAEIHQTDHEDDDVPHILKAVNGIKIKKCNNHGNTINWFCKNCQKEICSICSGHEKHEIVKIIDINIYQNLNIIDNNVNKAKKVVNEIYKEIKEKVINKITMDINNKISKLKSEIQENEIYLKNSIQKINALYSRNIKVNNNLIELMRILINNYKNSPNNYYTSINIINNAHFNFSILKDYNLNNALNFFASNYILEIHETKKKIKCIRCKGEKNVAKSEELKRHFVAYQNYDIDRNDYEWENY